MKLLITLLFVCIGFTMHAQDIRMFEASNVNINSRGSKTETTTAEPTKVTVNLETGALTIESPSEEVNTLLNNQSVFDITEQLGKLGTQYSLQLGEHIFAHFYLDMNMIIFTRNDIHPLQWGIQFTEVAQLGSEEG